jgi:hypothetical protein
VSSGNQISPFELLLRNSKKSGYNEFLMDPSIVTDPIVQGLTSPAAQEAAKRARQYIEEHPDNLSKMKFGEQHLAPELLAGEVTAIDGRTTVDMQHFGAIQAFCCGVGSVTYRRKIDQHLVMWSTLLELEQTTGVRDYLLKQEALVDSIKATAILRYWETEHALNAIAEPYVFLDGPIIHEWCAAYDEVVRLYKALLTKCKVIGVIKDLSRTKRLEALGNALQPSELFISGDLLSYYKSAFDSKTSSRLPHATSQFMSDLAPNIVRGVFRPRHKPYGFECHRDHLDPMIRIMAADAQMNHPAHEIPFLLNHIDQQLDAMFPRKLVRDRIDAQLLKLGHNVYYSVTDEYDFR